MMARVPNYIAGDIDGGGERYDTRTAWMVVGGWWRGHGAVARPAREREREREAYRVWGERDMGGQRENEAGTAG